MARDFVAASSQYLDNANALVSAEPFSMACWFNSDNAEAEQVLFSIADSSVTDHAYALRARGDVAGDPISAGARSGGGFGQASTTTGYSTGTWHHAAGVFTSSTSRSAFIDGGSKATNTSSRSPTGLDVTSIGRAGDLTPSAYMDGHIAEAAIWDIALSDDRVAILAKGISPLLVAPENLISYWPLIGRTSPEIELMGGFDLTVTGAVASAHPPIILPSKPFFVIPPTVASISDYRFRQRFFG